MIGIMKSLITPIPTTPACAVPYRSDDSDVR
jgi:hypothetical protein